MSTIPERISIKRRRDDDTVDTLVLQRDKDNKRRVTDHVYRRIQLQSQVGHDSSRLKQSSQLPPSAAPSASAVGIPVVKVTKPGDELQAYKAPQDSGSEKNSGQADFNNVAARQFRLTRELSSNAQASQSKVSRKLASMLRPHVPTFEERYRSNSKYDPNFHTRKPIDRIVSSKILDSKVDSATAGSPLPEDSAETTVSSFVKPVNQSVRNGRSLKDDPDTWDFESDQLADELAALAMELDPAAAREYQSKAATKVKERDNAMILDQPEDYVYETYVRVQAKDLGEFNSTLGYLIIDEEDEELWEQYIRDDDDDDDDWDEEDEDSNAEENPRNDYPEDEVSSDDEYGRSAYRYRLHASDDEQFDGDNAPW